MQFLAHFMYYCTVGNAFFVHIKLTRNDQYIFYDILCVILSCQFIHQYSPHLMVFSLIFISVHIVYILQYNLLLSLLQSVVYVKWMLCSPLKPFKHIDKANSSESSMMTLNPIFPFSWKLLKIFENYTIYMDGIRLKMDFQSTQIHAQQLKRYSTIIHVNPLLSKMVKTCATVFNNSNFL